MHSAPAAGGCRVTARPTEPRRVPMPVHAVEVTLQRSAPPPTQPCARIFVALCQRIGDEEADATAVGVESHRKTRDRGREAEDTAMRHDGVKDILRLSVRFLLRGLANGGSEFTLLRIHSPDGDYVGKCRSPP